ncbi:type IV secretory pathway TraG/TraD family ATPase VirD4, partial [Xanthobacter flavus]|nr:type IV secretory pathway TraG/TraD family ATPase VirD4 [Xanthobacter flavus]
MTPTKVLIGQMLVVFGIALAGTWAATQWVAFELGFQRRLGEPWFLIDNLPIYVSVVLPPPFAGEAEGAMFRAWRAWTYDDFRA